MGISGEWVRSSIHEDLDMRKPSPKWVPKCLNADQKPQWCQSSEQLLEFFRRDPNDSLSGAIADHGRNLVISETSIFKPISYILLIARKQFDGRRNVHKIFRTIISPVVLYGCQTWCVILRVQYSLRLLDHEVLRKIFEPKKGTEIGRWNKFQV
jgi:hypothetical protein